jgi:hypothetical protein
MKSAADVSETILGKISGLFTTNIGGITDTIGKFLKEAQSQVSSFASSLTEAGEAGGAGLGPIGIAASTLVGGLAAAAAAAATLTGIAVGLATHTANAGDEMLGLSHKVGVSVEGLADFKFVANQANTSLEAITGAVYKMEVGVGTSSKKTVDGLSRIGFTLEDIKNKRPEDAFTEIITKIGQIPNATNQAAIGAEIFGKGFSGIAQLTKEDIAGMLADFHGLGGGVTTEMAIAGDRFNDAKGRITAALDAVMLKLGAAFLPTLIAVTEKMGDAWASAVKNSGMSMSSFQDKVDYVIAGIINTIAKVVGVLADMVDAFIQAGLSVGKFLSDTVIKWIGITLEKIGTVSEAIGKFTHDKGLQDAAQSYTTAGKSIQDFSNNLTKGISGASNTVRGIAKTIGDFADNMAHTSVDAIKQVRTQIDEAATAERNHKTAVTDLGDAVTKNTDKTKSLTDAWEKQVDSARKFAGEVDDGTVHLDSLGGKQGEVNKKMLEAVSAMQAMGMQSDPLYQQLLNIAFQTANWHEDLGKVEDGIGNVIGKLPHLTTGLTDNYFALLKNTEQMIKLKDGISGDIGAKILTPTQQIEEATKKVVEKYNLWTGSLSTLSQGFGELSQNFTGAFGDMSASISNITSAMGDAIGAGSKFWLTIADPDKMKDVKTTWMDLANTIVGGVAAVGKATSGPDLGTNIAGGAVSGALTGASIAGTVAVIGGATAKGAAVAGVWGAAAGAIVGIMIAVFRGRSTRMEMEKVGHEWGTDISQGLSDEILKSAKMQFKGQEVAAAVFNMKEIIQEAGGLNALNFDQFIGHLRDVFVMLERGLFTVDQARQVLNDNFAAFAQQVVDSGQIASEKFQEIIQLNASSGTYAQTILDFVNKSTSNVGTSLAALAQPLLDSIATWKQATADAKDTGEAVEEVDGAIKANTSTMQDNAAFIAKSADELQNLGVIALGAFGAARKAGLDYVESVNAIGPGLDAIIAAQMELGITQDNVALSQIEHFRNEVNANQNLVKAAEALNDTMLGLSQIGGLNADTLAAMDKQGQITYDRLIGAGFTENEALATMGDYLKNLIDAHVQLGIPIDENTQKMIDLADQYGLLKKDGTSTNDILKTGFSSLTEAVNRLIETLGGVPIKVSNIGDAINHLPNEIPVNIKYRVEAPQDFPDMDLPQFATGTDGFKYFGAGTPVMLHGWEAVVTKDDYLGNGGGSWDASIGPNMNDVRPTQMSVVINNDFRGADVGDYASQERLFRRFEDAINGNTDLRRQWGVNGAV